MSLLTLLLVLPLLGAMLIALVPPQRERWIRNLALTVSVATMILAVWIAHLFDPLLGGLQFFVKVPWQLRLGSYFSLGVDGLSLPLVLLAVVLNVVALLASVQDRIKGYTIAMLLLESALLGVFMAQDWSLFYVFWELTLLPLFILINRWGGKRRGQAALNFMLYTMGGSVFMLIGLLIAFDAAGVHTFAMAEMSVGLQNASPRTQLLIFLGFFIGFGVKMPIFPLHGWLPLAHVEAPSSVSILLSGVLLKMGSYGLIRAGAMLPHAMVSMQGVLGTLALINLLYGGLLAWRQSDLKAMIAYSSISHMGVVLLGLAALNTAGVTGAVVQMVAHGLAAGALFLIVGLLYQRTHTRDASHYGGLVHVTPRFALFTTMAFLGAVGIPGTAGFVAELHAIVGSFQRWGGVAVVLSLGMLISAAYGVRTVGYLFSGSVAPGMNKISDLNRSELVAVGMLTTGMVGLGLAPLPLLSMIETSVTRFNSLFAGYL
ncbi:NADH dehydrogenase I subunit M [Gammaproteobacteria bacterium]